jgi:Flp pilus assembly protein CpaB
MDVPEATRVARPAWLNLRTALGLVLFGVAFLAGQRVLESARTTVPVWVATHDLASGSRLVPDDVAPAEVSLPSGLLGRYARGASDIEGTVLSAPVTAGEMIPIASMATGAVAEAGGSMTIPIDPQHAVGGAFRSGDRVDVFATFDAGDVRARTFAIVRGVEVVDVVRAGGIVVDESSPIGINLAVTPQQAAQLSFAVRAGEVDVVRVEGPSAAATVRPVRASDFE